MNAIKVLLCLLTISSTSLTSSAQGGLNVLKVGGNLLQILSDNESETYGGGGLSLEHTLKKKSSLCINLDFNTKKVEASDGFNTIEDRVSITTIEPEFRFYTQEPLNGFYIGFAPAVHILKDKVSGTISGNDSETRFGLGAKAGYQFAISKVRLQFGGGVGGFFPKEGEHFTGRYNLNLLLGFNL